MRIRDWSSDGVLFRSLDEYSDIYETKVGPRNGAKVVARAWTDPEFLAWLRRDASAAIKSFGFEGRQGAHMVVVENRSDALARVLGILPRGDVERCFRAIYPAEGYYKTEADRNKDLGFRKTRLVEKSHGDD